MFYSIKNKIKNLKPHTVASSPVICYIKIRFGQGHIQRTKSVLFFNSVLFLIDFVFRIVIQIYYNRIPELFVFIINRDALIHEVAHIYMVQDRSTRWESIKRIVGNASRPFQILLAELLD